MNPMRWEKIEEIFNNALVLEDVERNLYLAEACSHDPSLRKEVESLISSHEEDSTFLQRPVLEMGLKILADDPNQFSLGESIGPYQLLSILGRGGMGTVYLALDPRLGRKVALKVLSPSVTKDKERGRRFRQEARVASKISHPNVASIYEIGELKEHQFIAMEFVDGLTLRQRLSRGPVPISETLDIVIQTGRAIEAAHAVGIVHRDIKPENIMIRSDGYVKVLDFGLAKLTEAYQQIPKPAGATDQTITNPAGLTEPGMLMGTVTYMSPEQARGQEVDLRSDLWNLGLVLYELVTKTNPFQSETPSDTIAAILKSDPPPLSSISPGLTPEMDRIAAQALSKTREGRYQNVHDFLEDLSRLRGTLERQGVAEVEALIAAERAAADTAEMPRRSTQGTLASLEAARSVADYVVRTIKHRRVALFVMVAVLVTLLVALKYANYSPSPVAKSPINSIAVLPLINSTGDPATDYVSDGLSERLIERLSRLSDVKVIARSSSFKYKGKSTDSANIARDLGVEALVVGSVTQAGDGVQVMVDLVDASGTNHLWTGQYRDKVSNLPIVLNDISGKIAEKLKLDLSSDELNLMTRDYAASGNAYELYLKGRYYWNQLTEDSLDKSIVCFNQAIEIDPKFALAYTGLANSYAVLGGNYRPPADNLPKAELYAQKALALNDDLAEAHYAIAAVRYLYRWDLSGTEAELQRAVQLNPNYSSAHSLLASVSLTRGNISDATAHAKRALELDPLNLLHNVLLAYTYYYGRQNERALDQLQKTIKQQSDAAFLYNDLAQVYAQMGRYDEALAASQKATILLGKDPNTLSALGIVYAMSGKTKEARWVAETLEKLSKEKFVQAYLIASIYGALGDKDQAFIWLAKANQERSSQLLRFSVDPVFDKLRSDSRYPKLIQAMHIS